MGFLAPFVTYIFGKGMGPVLVPVLALGLLVSLYNNVVSRKEAAVTKIETTATAQCNASWLLVASKAKTRAAEAAASQAMELLKGEREIKERLTDDLAQIRTQHDELRTRFDAVGDKCLSDSVLSTLGGREPARKSVPAADLRGGAKGKPAGE